MMPTDSPPSALTQFALQQRLIMTHAIWSVFSATDDGKTMTIQGATMYASGSGVIPFALNKASSDA